MIDIDHFKQVNDRHGHDVGDALLNTLAQRLEARLREFDSVGRLGGEKFAVLLPNTDYDGVQRLVDDLVMRVASEPMPTVGAITISCGVARVCSTDDDGAAVLKRADLALYRAKTAGRNRTESRPPGTTRRWRRSTAWTVGIQQTLGRLLGVVTAFIAGHALTLALAALGGWTLPTRPVEVLVAASILVSAAHALRPLCPGKETGVAASFGLVHGLAFATTLDRLGLETWPRVAATLAFNLGIEAMQCLVITAVLPSLVLMRRTGSYRMLRGRSRVRRRGVGRLDRRAAVGRRHAGPRRRRRAAGALALDRRRIPGRGRRLSGVGRSDVPNSLIRSWPGKAPMAARVPRSRLLTFDTAAVL